VLLLSLASCEDGGNESDSSSYEDSQYFYIGKDSSKPIDRYNKPALIKDVKEYVAPVYAEAFDPNRQTLTSSEYYKLYSAIVSDSTVFPGVSYFPGFIESVNLADTTKTAVMINYMASKYGSKVFSEAEVRSLLSEKFILTDYDIYTFKISEYVDWQPKEKTYAFYPTSYNMFFHEGNADYYCGYRDMGENRYEFYFNDLIYEELEQTVKMMYSNSGMGRPPKEEYLADLYASEKDGIISIKYDEDKFINYYRCNTPDGVKFIRQDRTNGGTVVTLEYKDNKIKLVDIDFGQGTHKQFPETYSKIPTE
jgi:hypothetical protein